MFAISMNGLVNEVLNFQPLSRIPSTKRFGSFLSIRSLIQRFTGNCVVRSSGDFRMECSSPSRTLKSRFWVCFMVDGIRESGNHDLAHNGLWLTCGGHADS